ncbi:MAG TPA: ABC transporter substrate-binding protein [Acidimicrobiia bacterium]|nr:ABC transporter substrate-binding protein [Acidimicrobiia bacterium]
MRKRRKWLRSTSLIGVIVISLVVVSCAGDGETTTTGDVATTSAPSDGTTTTAAEATTTSGAMLEAGPGVTDDTITLGILTDLTGIFAAPGNQHVATANLYWDQVNEAGGVCDRQVELEVQDHGYDPQRAVAAYQAMEPNILALHQLLGSPVQAAVLPEAQEDEVAIGIVGWSSSFLDSESVVTTGATYDVQFIAGLQYFLDEGLIADGDTIAHVYFGGDFGENGLRGSSFFAEQHGMTIEEAAIDPTVTDLTAQVTGFQNAGATAILIGAAPPQLTAVVNAQVALGYEVPILGQVPPFVPPLLDNPDLAGPLVDRYYEATPIAPFGVDTPEGQELAAQADQFEDVGISIDIPFAWALASMWHQALEAACDQGDLTRAGYTAALHSLVDVETGVSTPLSYNVGGPSGTAVYIARPNPDVQGGLEVVAEDVTSPLVDEYELP